MPTFWETNSKILRERYPGLLEGIARESGDPAGEEIRIETAASGAPALSVGGLYVHSLRDPAREARRFAEAALKEARHAGGSPGPAVVLGFGLGYAAEAVAELAPEIPVIIAEKRNGLLRRAFELRDLSRLLSRPGVAIVPGGSGDGIIAALSHFEKTGGEKTVPFLLRNRALAELDGQWYRDAENRVRTWTMRDDVNTATLKKFGARWIRNLYRNMDSIRDLPGISRLEGLAARGGENSSGEPLPVFLAAAGPGLDGAGPLLQEIRKRCVIVAVDTSLRFMLRNGIEPDFAIVVDPQFWNSRHLDRCPCRRARLVLESAAYPPVFRRPFGGAYLCGSLFPLGIFIEKRVDPKGALGAGGSVATTAWDFSRILGAEKIWIAGLDLAYPGLRTHYHGALFEEKALAESGRLKPAETWQFQALRGGLPFSAPSAAGGTVLTDRRLSLYAAWFENRFRQFPGIANYSLLPGLKAAGARAAFSGLAIAGLEPAGEEDLLALPPRRDEIDRRLDAAFSRAEEDFSRPEEKRLRGERYKNAVAELRSGLDKIKAACKKGESIASRAMLQNLSPKEQEKTLSALDEINGFIAGSEVREIAGFLFSPQNTEAENAEAGFTAYMRSSALLYRSLSEAAGIYV